MNWKNVRLIFQRELRDQMRDRRTLFLIVVLPVLLYPLMGMIFFQISQFSREHATRVCLLGKNELPDRPLLLNEKRFAAELFSDPDRARLVDLVFPEDVPDGKNLEEKLAAAQRGLKAGLYEAVLYFPPGFEKKLNDFRARLQASRKENTGGQNILEFPGPEILYSTSTDKSNLTQRRLTEILLRWRDAIGQENLDLGGVPQTAVKPFAVSMHDVAEQGHRGAAMWSKMLPIMLLIWALTGAFYPAVDLCAGEKERGTLETLLSSPAERVEIVWGKLLTVMCFSMATVILNMTSLGITGLFVLKQFPNQIGAPPPMTPVWMLLALVPVSAMFSALCLALAAFAKSTKEGQYYLLPLIVIIMPLVMMPMSPGMEMNLGYSLIPVTGVVLLLRSLLEGQNLEALSFLPMVFGVTIACCYLAIRWAVDLFNSESVLFRESERFDLGLWFKQLRRERGETPSVAEAVCCGLLILMIRFFLSFAIPKPQSFEHLAVIMAVTQLAVVGTPALIMAVILTRNPRKTLLMHRPKFSTLVAAGALAVFIQPAAYYLRTAVTSLYQVDERMLQEIEHLLREAPDMLTMIAVMAVMPAIFEELAFRGFIMSGFRHSGHKWGAILFSSLLFGMTHFFLQQSLVATVIGVVIGIVAMHGGSLLPAALFHFIHNALVVSSARIDRGWIQSRSWLEWAIRFDAQGDYYYTPFATGLTGLMCAGIVWWFLRLPYEKTPEEKLQEALHGSLPQTAVG